MQRAIDLARLGAGNVAPNPMVGAVIVHQDKIIGEGYHQSFGNAHAEVNAVKNVTAKKLLKESTIYVTLEPCAHHGKTPPCADLIIHEQIPHVVIGCKDSFDEVDGKGIQKLKDAGVKVEVGILEEECIKLNKRFFCFHQKQRPYVILKWAQCQNGFMDIDRKDESGIFWITQKASKQLVHKWRHEEAAIMIGAQTLINDNPSLTTREYHGNSPIRIVLDNRNNIDLTKYEMNEEQGQTILIQQNDPKKILEELHQLNIQSVIIEGGKKTIEKFIQADLWDEARILRGINAIEKGVLAPVVDGTIISSGFFGKDQLTIIEHG